MSKRSNSTKQAFTGTDISACLKDIVNVESPVFKINFDPREYNYVSWAGDNFTRYYYIKGRTSIHNGLWEIQCELDKRATYKWIYQYCVAGKALYCSDYDTRDIYADDPRFSPECLDNWTHHDMFPDLSYLYRCGNIFGHGTFEGEPSDIWDITWEKRALVSGEQYSAYYMTGLGPGMYLVQARNTLPGTPSSVYTYIMDEDIFYKTKSSVVDYKNYILIANWLPLKSSEVLGLIDSSSKEETDKIYIGPDEITVTKVAGSVLWRIAENIVLDFHDSIDLPLLDYPHPLFLESSRWNTMQLNTPGGSTELNVDLMYPYGGRKLNFQTYLDLTTGNTSTKYTYDIVGTEFNNIAGSTAYASSYCIGFDMLGIISKQSSPLSPLIDIGGALAPAAAMMIGGAAAAPAAMIAGSTMNGIKAAMAPSPNGKAFNIGSALCEFLNNSQPGGITLRLKHFGCRELYAENAFMYDEHVTDPLEAYDAYCAKRGYPVNFVVDWHNLSDTNVFWVLDDIYIDPNGLTANPIYSEGLTDDILDFITADYQKGIWIE